ncbi:MAG: chromosome segregation protein SMC, partial [Candidatus Methanomethylophilaceae archaeon]|nr:chromosome segregation protein SMC [Candidatus Methanomethylophilaceae archaeon]
MEELSRTIRSCEAQLTKIGNVNLNAIDDYNAKKARYDDIIVKVAALEARIKDLNGLMARLNAEKKGLFMKTYEGIDVNFRAIYSELSGGGEAFMNLENEEDPFQGGLMINAKPKNGKLLRLEALSGGEKSLTALAFIFAIQESQPSPFYVLDEVDMFLDAVNAEMVAKRIKKSAAKVQFIQVSLRKVTLAQAEHLIGVARQPDGKSKVIIQPDFAEVSQYENQAKAKTEADGADSQE